MPKFAEMPKSLQALMVSLTRELTQRGIKSTVAADAVTAAILEWQQRYSGFEFYVPNMKSGKVQDRNRAILTEYEADPENSLAICQKYGVTRRVLYLICAAERERRAGEIERRKVEKG